MSGESSEAGGQERFVLFLFQKEADSQLGGLYHSVVGGLCDQLRDLVTMPREQTEIDVWIDSPGGSAHAAYKLALALREKACRVRAVVPDYAKSAATLLCLGADEIYMGLAAELGPLDAQIEHPDREGVRVSAMDYARCLDHLAEAALNMALRGGCDVLQVTGLQTKPTLDAVLSFAASFMQPLIAGIDGALVHRADSELRVARQYAERLLQMRGEALSTDDAMVGVHTGLSRKLVEDYPSHGFVISRLEAGELGLNAVELSHYDMADVVLPLHAHFRHGDESVVGLAPASDIDALVRDDEEGETECGPE